MNIPTTAVVCLCLVSFAGGYLTGDYTAEPRTVTVTEEKPVYVKGESVTKTQIAYVPKETVIERYIDGNGNEVTRQTVETTDLDANIGKTDFIVRINGQSQTFTKDEDERYVFEKNKLALDQTSRISLDVAVPPVDKTKLWAVGIGYSDEKKIAYSVDFPIGKSNNLGGWVYSGDENAVGIKWKF